MDPEAERDVTVVAARDVEAIGIGKMGGVAVRGTDRGDHEGAFGDLATGELDVSVGDAASPLHGAVVP